MAIVKPVLALVEPVLAPREARLHFAATSRPCHHLQTLPPPPDLVDCLQTLLTASRPCRTCAHTPSRLHASTSTRSHTCTPTRLHLLILYLHDYTPACLHTSVLFQTLPLPLDLAATLQTLLHVSIHASMPHTCTPARLHASVPLYLHGNTLYFHASLRCSLLAHPGAQYHNHIQRIAATTPCWVAQFPSAAGE